VGKRREFTVDGSGLGFLLQPMLLVSFHVKGFDV
jgi:hypothetical protein